MKGITIALEQCTYSSQANKLLLLLLNKCECKIRKCQVPQELKGMLNQKEI